MLDYSNILSKKLIDKYNIPSPFYTSYPTLSRWTKEHLLADYTTALHKLSTESNSLPISIYLHFPFCSKLCHYCCCNVQITKDRDRISRYLSYLFRELDLYENFFKERSYTPNIKEIHFGGGSPSYMTEQEFNLLVEKLNSVFKLDGVDESLIEIDIRTVNKQKINFYHKKGINRVSLGIQDFDPDVQKAVNRIQPIALVNELMPLIQKNYKSINFDLIYGLPLQTRQSFRNTIKNVIALAPDRICLYNYGHRPEIWKHQKSIEKYELPNIYDKTAISLEAIDNILDSGYERIGIDHFAKKTDDLAKAKEKNSINRIFNGYSPGRTKDLLSFGLSSTTSFNNYYSQNVSTELEYYNRIDSGKFPILRGCILNQDDLIRRTVINTIITEFFLDFNDIDTKCNINSREYFKYEINLLGSFIQDDIVTLNKNNLTITSIGKNFVQHVCKIFDRYWLGGEEGIGEGQIRPPWKQKAKTPTTTLEMV